MTDEDRKRVEEIRAAREADTLIFWEDRVDELLEIIDRMRAATREDVERVAKAIEAADPMQRYGSWSLLVAARAALRAMGMTLEGE